MAETIYEKYGGFARIHQLVMSFYDAVLDHDDLGPYFEDVDMRKLIDHQTKFVSALLGGPASFTDDHLRRAHAGLDISPAHFDEMKIVLGQTLRAHGFEDRDVETVLGAVELRRPVVVEH